MSHRYMLAGTSQNPYGPGSGGGGSDYGLGSGSAGGGVLRDNTLGAPEEFNLQFTDAGPGEPTKITAPISLLVLTVGGAIAGASVKGWVGALLGGAVGYMAGAGLRATTGLKA